MRKSVALIVAAGLLVTLAGCSSSGSSSCSPLASSGDASKLISATGDFGSAFTTDIPTPLIAKTTQVSTLIKGDGATVQPDGLAEVTFSLFDGTTGQNLQGSSSTGSAATEVTSSILSINNAGLPGLQKGLACQTVGSRVAVAIAPADGFGDSTNGPAIDPTDTLVMVFDITGAFPNRADGAIEPAEAGFPSVALGPDGRPGITIPSGDLPTEQKTSLLKRGDGAAVADGDQVVVQYTAVIWDSKTVAASTWTAGQPKGVKASSSDPLSTAIVPDLVGKTVGSQYITVVPPSAGFGDTASSDPAVPANSTLVYVVDVLGILPAAATGGQ